MSQRSQRHEASSTMATHDDFIFIFDFNANGNEWILMESNGNMRSDVRGRLLTSADLGKSLQSVWIVWDCASFTRNMSSFTTCHQNVTPIVAARSGADAGAPGAVGGPPAPGEVHDAP